MLNHLALKIGAKLRICRLEAGITQPALGKLIRMDGENCHITICNWECGRHRPTLEHIERYSRLFHKPMSWFFNDQVEPDQMRDDESVAELVQRILLMMDKMKPHAKLEKARQQLHRLLRELETT